MAENHENKKAPVLTDLPPVFMLSTFPHNMCVGTQKHRAREHAQGHAARVVFRVKRCSVSSLCICGWVLPTLTRSHYLVFALPFCFFMLRYHMMLQNERVPCFAIRLCGVLVDSWQDLMIFFRFWYFSRSMQCFWERIARAFHQALTMVVLWLWLTRPRTFSFSRDIFRRMGQSCVSFIRLFGVWTTAPVLCSKGLTITSYIVDY